MDFATDITDDECAAGFEIVEHLAHGKMIVAQIGNGLRAVKMRDRDGVVLYAICDDTMIMLYESAHSLFDLRRRFAVPARKRAAVALKFD
jgi:hypothetical protein